MRRNVRATAIANDLAIEICILIFLIPTKSLTIFETNIYVIVFLYSLCVRTQTADRIGHRLVINFKLVLQLNNLARMQQGFAAGTLEELMTRESLIESEDAVADARRDSDRAGDKYYATITEWTVSRLTKGTGGKCYELAMAYDRAIDRLIDRLKHQVLSAASRRSISIAGQQKSLLKADLNYLGDSHASFQKLHAADR